jgi:hypothetical protein
MSGDFYDPTLAPYYENSAIHAEESLQRAVTLSLGSLPTEAQPGERITLSVRITNDTGHRLPTGYADGRRVWLTVEVEDVDGALTTVSGTYDDASGTLDVSDPQLHVYEAVHGHVGTGHDGHLALSNTILRDSRIPPSGFRPPTGLEPVGVDYSGGASGSLRNWDDAQFEVTIPPSTVGPLTVRVRARYQSTTRDYVETLAHDNHTDTRGQDLLDLYDSTGRAAPYDMASATAEIQIIRPSPDAGVDASADVTIRDVASSDVGIDGGGVVHLGGGCLCTAGRFGARPRSESILVFGTLLLIVRWRRRN